MPLGVETRDTKPNHFLHAVGPGQSLDLFERMYAFHRGEHALRGEEPAGE
jgi:hypothetical protein